MLFDYDRSLFDFDLPRSSVERAIFRFKKMLPDYVFATVQMEGNPFTFPEVKTLLDGVTVGGHKLSDMQQVLNQKDSCNLLVEMLNNETFDSSNQAVWMELNRKVAKGEALIEGVFRDGHVGIGGTEFRPPDASELPQVFLEECEQLSRLSNPIEMAYAYSAWAAVNQFFWDGNKRTGRLIMNGILMKNGFDSLAIPAKSQLEYNQACLELYDERNANALFELMRDRHIEITKSQGLTR